VDPSQISVGLLFAMGLMGERTLRAVRSVEIHRELMTAAAR
jgi:hypothetical protein